MTCADCRALMLNVPAASGKVVKILTWFATVLATGTDAIKGFELIATHCAAGSVAVLYRASKTCTELPTRRATAWIVKDVVAGVAPPGFPIRTCTSTCGDLKR